jgi:hypothetical protein
VRDPLDDLAEACGILALTVARGRLVGSRGRRRFPVDARDNTRGLVADAQQTTLTLVTT